MAEDAQSTKAIEAFFWLEPFRQVVANPFQQTKVLWHLPDDVSNISKTFSEIPQYCIPDIGKIQLEKADDAKSEFMIFTLRDSDKKKVYGICYRHIFRGKNRRFDCLRRPRHCLCIITRQPYFSLFRNLLQDIYAYALIEGAGGMCRQYTQTLLEPFLRDTPSSSISLIPNGPECGAFNYPESFWNPPKVLKMQFREFGVLPLLVSLGVDRLFMLLSAIMTEKKIALIADDHQELTAAVYGALSMMHPFTWPHNIYTVAPASIVPSIVADTPPFIAGIRRDSMKELPRSTFDNVVVVDLDQGMVTFTGPSPIHDLIGDSATALKQATENLDRLRAGITSVFLGKSADSSADSNQRDIMAMLVLDLKSVLSNKPGSNSLQSVASGLLRGLPSVKSEEESAITWAFESEKTLRDCLTTFYVYLFGDFEDFLLFPTDPNAPFTLQNRFDRNGFLQRHSQNGLGRLQEFMNDFLRTGVFKKFLVDMIKRVEVQRSLLNTAHRNTRTSSVSSVSSAGSSNINTERSSEGAQDLDDLFFVAANELRVKQIPLTANNCKQSVTSKSTVGAGEVTLAFGLKIGNANFHQLTLLYTNANSNEERLDNEDVQVPVWELADRTKESSHSLTHLERILADARNSDYIRKIFTVLAYRLESARASQARGVAGAAGMRALYVLKLLLVQGPHASLSHGLDLLPLLRRLLLSVKYSGMSGSSSTGSSGGSSSSGGSGVSGVTGVTPGLDFIAGQAPQHDLRPLTLRVISLLMDHRKLMTQRQVYQIALHSKRLFFKSAIDGSKGGLVALTQSKAVKKVLFFANNKQVPGRHFIPFATMHQTLNELRQRNMDPGGLKCNPFEAAELEEDEDEVGGAGDEPVVSMANPAAAAASGNNGGNSAAGSIPAPTSARNSRPARITQAEVNLLDFDQDVFPPATTSTAHTATAAGAPASLENPKYRVTNIDTGEVKHIQEFQNIPYDTFQHAPPPKPARPVSSTTAANSAAAGAGSIKLMPPPNDNLQRRKPATTGGASSSSRSVSPVPRTLPATSNPPPNAATTNTTSAPRTPTNQPVHANDFDAFTPTTPPPAPTPTPTPAGVTTGSTNMYSSTNNTSNGNMKLAAGLEDLAFHPTTTPVNNGLSHSGSASANPMFAATGNNNNNVPPPRTNMMTRGAMPIPASSSAHMMQHAMNANPPARPAFAVTNNGPTTGQHQGKPKDPFADLLSPDFSRPPTNR